MTEQPLVLVKHPITLEIQRVLAEEARLQVGLRKAPPDATAPYLVLHPIGSGDNDETTTGDVGLPGSMIDWVWQVTSVGRTVDECEGFADRVQEIVLARVAGTGVFLHPLHLDGMNVVNRWRGMSGEAIEEGVVWSKPDRFHLLVSLT